ncbi:MAG: SIR2 family NAD-dependent protein deacylase [Aquincola tertiaricarbonis]
MPEAAVRVLRERIARASRVCVLTGAGMSAESGIPTFRDAQTGLWARFDPMQLASEPGFRADPRLVWDWYQQRREGVRRAQPHAGHQALAAFAQRRPGVLTVVTQNVDDLHQRAGLDGVLRLHGDLLQDRWLAPSRHMPPCDLRQALPGHPPRCAQCGNLVRPGVVWFGEALPADVLADAEDAARGCTVMLVVGTSGAVWPAAGLAGIARRAGAWVAIVNPAATEIDGDADEHLAGTAAGLLPRLLAA